MKYVLYLIFCPFFLFAQTQIGNDINGRVVGNNTERIVSLSSNGDIVAIGSPFDSGTFETSGVVRIYQNLTGVWQQIGQNINGEAENDRSGFSVNISPDGTIVAIGSIYNDGNGNSSGHVRIYRNQSGLWTQIGDDIDGEASGDFFGYSISLNLDGSIVAIGANANDGNGARSGHVKIYKNESGIWTQIGGNIEGEAPGDRSGNSVHLSSDGSIVAIGARLNDGNGNNSGHIRVYKNESGIWTQVGTDIDGAAENDNIGTEISLSSDGSTVATNSEVFAEVRVYKNISGVWAQIGSGINEEALFDSGNNAISLSSDGGIVAIGSPSNDGNGNDSGHVRVFENVGDSWTQIGEDIDGVAVQDLSGYSVSLSFDGKKLAIGAKSNSVNGVLSDDVRIFENLGGVWSQLGNDINDGNTAGDRSGKSVFLSSDGNILALGIPNNDGNGSGSGQVRIYENQSGIWTQIGEDINGEALGDDSGFSISLNQDGTIVAIGAISNSDNGEISGHVRIYEYISGIWTQIGEDIDGVNTGNVQGDRSGFSVSLSSDGRIVAIGAPLNNENGNNSGHVRVYKNESDIWTQVGSNIVGEAANDEFGNTVCLSSDGEIIAIGAIGNENRTGHVRVYKNEGNIWTQVGEDINGEAEFDNSGGALSLSSDGNIVAIGAAYNNANGEDSGHVRIYRNESGSWIQQGEDIEGNATGDGLGYSISLNTDGSTVAIGAPFKDENGTDSGQVVIYKNISGVWTQIGAAINGDAIGGNFGFSVSLNSNGSSVAIGAPFTDGSVFNLGQVRVYDLTNVLSVKNIDKKYFSLYPNPISNILHIKTNHYDLNKVIIYNNLGQIIFSTNSNIINVENLKSGIYFIKVFTNKGNSTERIIKN